MVYLEAWWGLADEPVICRNRPCSFRGVGELPQFWKTCWGPASSRGLTPLEKPLKNKSAAHKKQRNMLSDSSQVKEIVNPREWRFYMFVGSRGISCDQKRRVSWGSSVSSNQIGRSEQKEAQRKAEAISVQPLLARLTSRDTGCHGSIPEVRLGHSSMPCGTNSIHKCAHVAARQQRRVRCTVGARVVI